MGAAVTAILAEYAASLDSRKVTSGASPGDLQGIFDEPLPEQGIPINEISRAVPERRACTCDAGGQPTLLRSVQPHAIADRCVGRRVQFVA